MIPRPSDWLAVWAWLPSDPLTGWLFVIQRLCKSAALAIPWLRGAQPHNLLRERYRERQTHIQPDVLQSSNRKSFVRWTVGVWLVQ